MRDYYYECQKHLLKADIVLAGGNNRFVGVYYYGFDNAPINSAPLVMGKSDEFMPIGIDEELMKAGIDIYYNEFPTGVFLEQIDSGTEIPEKYYKDVADIMAFTVVKRHS